VSTNHTIADLEDLAADERNAIRGPLSILLGVVELATDYVSLALYANEQHREKANEYETQAIRKRMFAVAAAEWKGKTR
jgi:hypothetical protein